MKRKEIERIWNAGQNAVMPIDICGATAMHASVGDRAVTLFIYRSKEAVITDILSRSTSIDDKLKRIMSLDHEYANQGLCDRVVFNDKTVEDAAQAIISMVSGANI